MSRSARAASFLGALAFLTRPPTWTLILSGQVCSGHIFRLAEESACILASPKISFLYMSAKKRTKAKSSETVTLFLRVPPAVKDEFARQAARQHRNLTGHFTALVESGRAEAA